MELLKKFVLPLLIVMGIYSTLMYFLQENSKKFQKEGFETASKQPCHTFMLVDWGCGCSGKQISGVLGTSQDTSRFFFSDEDLSFLEGKEGQTVFVSSAGGYATLCK
jgi:hypothetical protein